LRIRKTSYIFYHNCNIRRNCRHTFFNVAAGSTGNGVIKEAKDRVIQGNDVWVVGVDKDQYAEGYYDDAKSKSVILTSMLKRVDVAAYDVLKQEMEGKFAGGTVLKFDIKNNGVGIPEVNPNLTDEQVKTILSYRDKVIDGSMTISTLPKRLQ
jgi:basic membrane protein A